ncbi:MAG TPA: hypothetical protein VGO93_12550 [Candidatus Xenobia bacterium]|jgi:hypothetical protein
MRTAFILQNELINDYVDDNPDSFPLDDVDIVQSWQEFERGTFGVLKHLKKGSVFVAENGRVCLVQGPGRSLADWPFQSATLEETPVLVEAVLLPFKSVIIDDGVLSCYSLRWPSMREEWEAEYREARRKRQVVSSLLLPSESDWESQWRSELDRRGGDVRSGQAVGVAAQQVFEELRGKLG